MTFNPRIPCGMRLARPFWLKDQSNLSIHASHAGCDSSIAACICRGLKLSIHASHAGCDTVPLTDQMAAVLFQSTHPMRDATQTKRFILKLANISIHASHAGCDALEQSGSLVLPHFNPRIPCGMRLKAVHIALAPTVISIHASHAGCDQELDVWAHQSKISIHASHAGCDS